MDTNNKHMYKTSLHADNGNHGKREYLQDCMKSELLEPAQKIR
jgi:hypothetical protein